MKGEVMIYTIEKKAFGIMLSFEGMMDEETAKKFAEDFMKILDSFVGSISLLINLINGKPMPAESQAAVNDCYKAVIQRGLIRSANIVPSPLMKLQMIRRAKEFGTYDKARYIDSSANPNWEQIALEWIEKGIDPDK